MNAIQLFFPTIILATIGTIYYGLGTLANQHVFETFMVGSLNVVDFVLIVAGLVVMTPTLAIWAWRIKHERNDLMVVQ